MKTMRIQDQYNPDKVWLIRRYTGGNYYVNQEVKGMKMYSRDRRMTARLLKSIGVLT